MEAKVQIQDNNKLRYNKITGNQMVAKTRSPQFVVLFLAILLLFSVDLSYLPLSLKKDVVFSNKGKAASFSANSGNFPQQTDYQRPILTSTILLPTDFSFTKTAVPTSGSILQQGQIITYFLSLRNQGTITAQNLIITDSFPLQGSLIYSQTTLGTPKQTNQGLSWTIADLEKNLTVTGTFRVMVTAALSTPTLITNVAYLSGSNVASLVSSNVVTHTVQNDQPPGPVFLPIVLRNHPPPLPEFANADFEDVPNSSWAEQSICCPNALIVSAAILPGSVTPHSGNRLAWLGGSDNEVSDLFQTVTLPAGHSTMKLGYWYWIASKDSCGNDFGYIRANKTNIFTHNLCTTNDTNGWHKKTLDVTPYIGQSVTFHFAAELNSSLNSNFFIDDVFFE